MSRKSSRASVALAQPFSSREQKVIVRYLCYQEVDPSEIHKLLSAACGKVAPSYKEVRGWIQDISDGKEEIDNCVCAGGRKMSGLQSDATTDPALIVRLERLLNADIRLTAEKLSEMTVSPIQTIQTVITNLFGLKKVCEKWVPRLWTPEQKLYRINICNQLLELYQEEGSDLLERIVVADTSFVLYHLPNTNSSNQQNGQKRGKYRPTVEPEHVYCAFFYDMQGMLAAEALPNQDPPTAEEYVNILKESLIPALKRKRGSPTKPLYLLQSILPEHNTILVQNALKELNLVPLPNAASSPDFEPFEFWFYRNMKRSLEALHFNSRTDLWSAVQRHIHSLTDAEFSNSITCLPDRWNGCIDKGGLHIL